MPSPLFQFSLRPIHQIQPWGEPEDPNLHWFGLTDGMYWIQAGEHTLFEYSHAAQVRSGVTRYCDYQVVRLYEDILDLAPYALEPVPEELQQYIALDEARPWNHYWKKWCESVDASDSFEDSVKLLDEVGSWIGQRTLDSAYLNPSTNIVIWSNQDSIHIQWDNRDKLLQGRQAWSAQFGSWRLPRTRFMDEVRSLHFRLMEQMALRLSQVASGALPRNIRVDLEGLEREQQTRSKSIERYLGPPTPPTDWSTVLEGVALLESDDA